MCMHWDATIETAACNWTLSLGCVLDEAAQIRSIPRSALTTKVALHFEVVFDSFSKLDSVGDPEKLEG